MCIFRWECEAIHRRKRWSESKLLACVPPWLLLAIDDAHKLRQRPSFRYSPLTLMLLWIYSAHSLLALILILGHALLCFLLL